MANHESRRSPGPTAQALVALSVLATFTCPVRPVAAASGGFHAGGVGFGYSTGSRSHAGSAFQYALILRGNETQCAVEDDDSWHTLGELQHEVERTGHEVFWFSRDGRSYVIRDSATVERVGEILEPMRRLGEEQGRLGSIQGELGRKQGELGNLQGRLGDVQARLADLEAVDDPRYERELQELHEQLRALSERVRVMGVQQRALGEQQQDLGRQQRQLGAQQRRASLLAWDQLQDLADQAIAKGTAESIDGD